MNSSTDYKATSASGTIHIRRDPNSAVRQSISLPPAPDPAAKKADDAKAKKKSYSLLDFAKFTIPYLWKGGFWIRLQTILTVLLLIVSKMINVLHPLILKYAIDGIACTESELTHCNN